MIKVPKYIIDLYRFENNSYPCISYIKIFNYDILRPLINKSETLWYLSDENNEKRKIVEEFSIYDKTGIYIFYQVNENNEYDVFILSKIDKRDIVDFTLYTIKKQSKNYGNNSNGITREN